jgi:hypothetical protein
LEKITLKGAQEDEDDHRGLHNKAAGHHLPQVVTRDTGVPQLGGLRRQEAEGGRDAGADGRLSARGTREGAREEGAAAGRVAQGGHTHGQPERHLRRSPQGDQRVPVRTQEHRSGHE